MVNHENAIKMQHVNKKKKLHVVSYKQGRFCGFQGGILKI